MLLTGIWILHWERSRCQCSFGGLVADLDSVAIEVLQGQRGGTPKPMLWQISTLTYLYLQFSLMEEEEFSDFERPADPLAPTALPAGHAEHSAAKRENDLFAEAFFDFPTPSINPSYSLATQSVGQLDGAAEGRDLEHSAWPHFNKIMSENLTSSQPNLFAFEKSHSQTEHQIGIFNVSTTLYTQNIADFPQKPTTLQQKFLFSDYANIQTLQNPKTEQIETPNNTQQINPFIGLSAETKFLEQVKVQQSNPMPFATLRAGLFDVGMNELSAFY